MARLSDINRRGLGLDKAFNGVLNGAVAKRLVRAARRARLTGVSAS